MHKHFGKRTKKKHHIVLICSAVVIAAFVLRMPVEMNVADACGMQQKVNVLSSSMHNRQAEDYLNDAGEFCISQTVLREGKPSVVPQVRRIGLRFLPVSHMTQQWLLVENSDLEAQISCSTGASADRRAVYPRKSRLCVTE